MYLVERNNILQRLEIRLSYHIKKQTIWGDLLFAYLNLIYIAVAINNKNISGNSFITITYFLRNKLGILYHIFRYTIKYT